MKGDYFMEEIRGKVWKFGDNIDTGQLAPGRFIKVEEYSQYCLENLRPGFAKQVQPGDIIVAGQNFGCGSSRETAVRALLHLQVGAVVAGFFARIFFRNAVNLGLPVIETSSVDKIEDGDELSVFPLEGRIINHTRQEEYQGLILPEHMMEIIRAGGLVEYLAQKIK
jgi:3-isopropylmalate/(R)-2-methylmalate dehydratase small subunit